MGERERSKATNVPCSLISKEENDKLFNMLGGKCVTLASSVAQLYLTDIKSNHSHWIKHCCGVACFVKDHSRKAYFIRVFDMERSMCVWEQELYNSFQYSSSCPFFHLFEADSCMAGLNFADNEEASKFNAAVTHLLQERLHKKRERRRNQPSNTGVVVSMPRNKSESMQSLPTTKDDKSSKKGRKKRLTKDDIGTPTNFIHRQHIGWDPEKGFEVNADEALLGFFTKAGVSEKDLNDNETRKFIYDFLDTHGGVEAAKQEGRQITQAPIPPSREAPPTPRQLSSTRMAPPPPPLPPSHPPAISRTIGTAFNQPSGLPRMPEGAVHNSSVPPPPPPPPPMPVAPPPPPPPAPPSVNCSGAQAPPPPPPPPMGEAVPDSKNAFLEEIRRGKTLTHVTEVVHPVASTDDRGALLNQIRQGVDLKPVSRSTSPAPRSHGIAEALAKALQERNHAMQHTDESDSGDDEDVNDDDEWED